MAVFDQSSKKTKTNYKNEDGSFITTIPVTRSDAVVVTDGNTTIYLDETLTDIKSKLTPDAEPNQFAFSTLTLNGDATKKIEANAKTSNLNLVAGSNITLTPGTGDKCEVTITAKDTTYETVTTTESGLMSAASYVKLNGIEENANKYVHYTGTQAGTYKSVTVNAEGHVTAGTNPTTLSGYGINDAYIDADKSQIKLGTNTFGFGDILRTSSSLDASKLTGTLSLNAPTATKATNDSDGNKITTTYATKTELNSILATNDAMIFKGTIGTGGTITSLPASHNAGWTYKVITANTYAGVNCEVGDLIICITDGTTSNNNHWTVAQTNIDGAVTGPTSVTGDRIAVFNGTSGKIIKDSGYSIETLKGSIDAIRNGLSYIKLNNNDGKILMNINYREDKFGNGVTGKSTEMAVTGALCINPYANSTQSSTNPPVYIGETLEKNPDGTNKSITAIHHGVGSNSAGVIGLQNGPWGRGYISVIYTNTIVGAGTTDPKKPTKVGDIHVYNINNPNDGGDKTGTNLWIENINGTLYTNGSSDRRIKNNISY